MKDVRPREGREATHAGSLAPSRKPATTSTAPARNLGKRVAIWCVVVALYLYPRSLYSGASERYVGIATAETSVYTYTIAVCCGLLVLAGKIRHVARLAIWPLPFVAITCIMFVVEWDASSRVLSGLAHLATAVAAFFVALAIPHWYTEAKYDFAGIVCLCAFGQGFFVLLEVLGVFRRSLVGPQSSDLAGRAIGLTDHPNQLARLMFVALVCALLLIGWRGRWRTLGLAAVPVAVGCLALTQSRSALLASGLLLVGYFSFSLFIGRHKRKSLALLGIMLVVVLPQLSTIIDRFELDPTGGARPYLNQVAEFSIEQRPLIGVGPNEYVNIVGALDSLTASGVPVHNVFLLTAAELGVVAAAALWIPIAIAPLFAIWQLRAGKGDEVAGQALVVTAPGLVLLGLTTWGLMAGSMLVLLAMVYGLLISLVGSSFTASEKRAST